MENEDEDSFSEDTLHAIEKFDILDLIILKKDSLFTYFWRLLHVITCMGSSYVYAYIAVFGIEHKE